MGEQHKNTGTKIYDDGFGVRYVFVNLPPDKLTLEINTKLKKLITAAPKRKKPSTEN